MMSQVQVLNVEKIDPSQHNMSKDASSCIVSSPVLGYNNFLVCFSQSAPSGSWILNSGASDHIAGNSSLFSNLSPTKIPHFITLADGSQVKATGIPRSPFNLISISKLTRTLNYSVTFFSDSFYIQDQSTEQMIGTDSELHGLYYLQPSSSTICTVTDSPSLLRNRLGHPSLNKLKKRVPNLSHLQSLQCESCQHGKHARSSFQNKEKSRSKFSFEIVHSNVWGPNRVTPI